MRFGRSFQDVTWLQRGFQGRLLRWVGVLVVALVAAQLMWSATRKPSVGTSGARATEEDRRVVLESNEQLPPDTIRIVPGAGDVLAQNQPGRLGEPSRNVPPPMDPLTGNGEDPLGVSLGAPSERTSAGGQSGPVGETPVGGSTDTEFTRRGPANVDVFAETAIDKSILRDVTDNTLGVRISESDAFYRLLSHARLLPAEYLEEAARNDLGWDNLMADPKVHRGELVEIRGDLRRLTKIQATQNSFGVIEFYEAWIFTADSSSHPWRVVTSQISEGISLGDGQMTPVRVAGYFFKREGYDANGGLRVTPLLVGKRLELVRATSTPPTDMTSVFYLVAVIGVVLLTILAMLMSISISDMKYQRELMASRNEASAATLQSIPEINVPSVFEQLEQISGKEAREELPDLDEMTASSRNGSSSSAE